jgi:hypothetical protein
MLDHRDEALVDLTDVDRGHLVPDTDLPGKTFRDRGRGGRGGGRNLRRPGICAAVGCNQPIPAGSSPTRRFCSKACRFKTAKPRMAARPRSTWPPAITRLQDRLADLEAEAETASVDDLPMVGASSPRRPPGSTPPRFGRWPRRRHSIEAGPATAAARAGGAVFEERLAAEPWLEQHAFGAKLNSCIYAAQAGEQAARKPK